jgi:hypothetical protein
MPQLDKFERHMVGRVPSDEHFAKWARETKESRADILKRHETDSMALWESQAADFEKLTDGRHEEMPSEVEYKHRLENETLKRTQAKELAAFGRVEQYRQQIISGVKNGDKSAAEISQQRPRIANSHRMGIKLSPT